MAADVPQSRVYLAWPKVVLPMAAVLLLLSPLVYSQAGLPLLLLFLQLPIYMIHQYEEHGQGRFKAWVNSRLGRGKEVLGDEAIFWINTAGVWGVDGLAFAGAALFGPAAGLAAVYLSTINGISHIGATIRSREYNPGVWTSVLLFLPLGIATLVLFARQAIASPYHHAIGAAVSIAIHAAIVGHAMRRLQ
jgi:hypothetical protein